MNKSEVDQNIIDRIRQLEEKYKETGQDMASYLDGLLHADYLKYWDYINLDSLLALQQPKTHFPDEMLFIIYHQITELYFKLICWEMSQIHEHKHPDAAFFKDRLRRINRYFEQLNASFGIMMDGMERKQFLKFRMSLLPASGFQSAQYRMIEIGATDLANLVPPDKREISLYSSTEVLYDRIYWKEGATELASDKKTLTLSHFEEKYDNELIRLAENTKSTNFNRLFHAHYKDCEDQEILKELLRRFDLLANVDWTLAHYRLAVRHLKRDPEDITRATGGTNWHKYLPPRFQKVIFFPELWTEEERDSWGRGWVLRQLSEAGKHRINS